MPSRFPRSDGAGMAPQRAPKVSRKGAVADILDLDSASIVVSSGSGSERVVHVYPDRADRTSSGGSTSARSPASSGGSFDSEESWSEVQYDDDEIDPSDSASRSRHLHSRRHTVEAPAPSRRHSSHRRVVEVERDELPPRRHSSRRHHSSRHDSSHSRHRRRDSARRVPSDESSSTVASHDDYPPYGHHGMPRAAYPPMGGYSRPPQSHGGYPPSMASAGYPDPYAPPHQALVHMQRQDPFGYPQPNPFAPQSQAPNPFSPISSHEGSSYFATDPMGPPPPRPHRPEGPPRPQSFAAPSAYPGSELMAPYHGGMPPYGHFGMPGYPPYPPMAGWPASNSSSPPPKEDRSIAEIEALKEMIKQKYNDDAKKKEEKTSEIDDLKKLIKKHEEEAVARQKAWSAEKEAEAAARAAEKAKIEEEKKRKQEIADAQKKAKEDAEKKAEEAAKKAKDEHDKKLAEAEKAREDADKAKKALEEEVAKSKPSPDSAKAPIRFKDAVGRKFSFPWPYCKTWKGMENLIKQAFLHVDVIGDHVHQGHYDLTGPDGEIILPQVWDIVVQPDWEVTMHLWPMEEEKKKSPDIDSMIDPFGGMGLGGMPNFGDLGMIPEVGGPGIKKSKSGKKGDGSKKKKAGGSPEAMIVNPSMPPPPPHHGMPPPPGGAYGDPFAPYGGGFPPMPMPEKEKKGSSKPRSNSKRSKDISPLQAWFAGGSMNAKPAKKK